MAMATAGAPRQLRVLLDAPEGLRRLRVEASTVEELRRAVQAEVQSGGSNGSSLGSLPELDLYDSIQEKFVPLPVDLAALPSLARLRLRDDILGKECAGTTPTAALPWRRFPIDMESEGFPVGAGRRRLVVRGVENSGQGTGHTTWDGAVVLAKYLEHVGPEYLAGKRVLETGAGTGLVGLACAVLGAGSVTLTDLPYTLDNLRANVERNEEALQEGGGSSGRVAVREGDWFKPPAAAEDGEEDGLGPVDLIVAADVVWLDELVAPLAGYLDAVVSHPSSRHADVLMSYQSRSRRTDLLLHEELRKRGFVVEEIPAEKQHPDFRAPGVIHVYLIRKSKDG